MNLKINIPEGYEIDKESSTFENIVFKPLAPKYPLSVKEIGGRNWYISANDSIEHTHLANDLNQVSSESRTRAFLDLMQLVELRDAYNEIDGEKEFRYDKPNYVIRNYKSGSQTAMHYDDYKVLHFRKESTRDLFLKNFSSLIEEAKELI